MHPTKKQQHEFTGLNEKETQHVECQAAKQPASSADQNTTIHMLQGKPKEWPPCFSHTLKHSDTAKDWLTLNKTLITVHLLRWCFEPSQPLGG